MDDPLSFWGSQAGPLDLILQRLNDLDGQRYTQVQIVPQKLDKKLDKTSHPVHVLSLLSQTSHDDERQDHDDVACQADRQSVHPVYPQVHGIDKTLVKQVIDLHLSGMSWSAIALQLGKNYSRDIKPIREIYTSKQ